MDASRVMVLEAARASRRRRRRTRAVVVVVLVIGARPQQRILMRFAGDVILFTDEFVVVQHVEFLPCAQLFATHHTREAVEMKYFVSSFSHQVARRDALRTAPALCAVPPEEIVPTEELALSAEALVGEIASAVVASHTFGVPRALQDVEQELVKDGLSAARALDDHAGSSGGVQHGGVGPTYVVGGCNSTTAPWRTSMGHQGVLVEAEPEGRCGEVRRCPSCSRQDARRLG